MSRTRRYAPTRSRRCCRGEPLTQSAVLRERFARFRTHAKARLLGDVGSFYLPYLKDAIAVEPDIRIVCLRRPREEVVTSFCEWLDQTMPLPTNHWARQPARAGTTTRTAPERFRNTRRRTGRKGFAATGTSITGTPRNWRAATPSRFGIFDTYEA